MIVLGVDRGQIRLGFAAPDDVTILREELGSIEDRPHTPHEKAGGMLVLTRTVEEGVLIGKNIIVKILGLERGRVKVGINAPGDVKIL